MLDFVIFAITAVVGLIVILLFCFIGNSSNKKHSLVQPRSNISPVDAIPRWNIPPADDKRGDLDVMTKKFGSLHQYLLHLHDNGKIPVTSFWWGKTHMVSFCSPQAFKESTVLVNRPAEPFLAFEPLITKYNIQYANDEDWNQRSKSIYHTLKGDDLKSYFPQFVEIAQEAESTWLGYSPDMEVSLLKELYPLTTKAVTRCCLGDVFKSKEELGRLTESHHICWRIVEEGVPEPGSEKEAEFLKHKQVLVDIVCKIIHERKNGEGLHELPFIDSLLQNYDSEDKIVADTLSFLLGGFHTSGLMFTWMLWYLADHPESQDRLRAEIDQETGGGRGDRLKEYVLRNDTFLRQVQDETIRLSTLASYSARYCDEDITICGYKIPAKTPMIQALGVGLKNKMVWEDVDSWNPDRFAANGRRGNEFCPFGVHSRRRCPGYLFSYFEVGIFASILLSSFRVVPVEGQTVIQTHGLVTEPKEDIKVYIRSRETAVQ